MATTFKLHRRRVLRGLGIGGISVALPRLEAMLDGRGHLWSEAHGATARRLFIYHWPQGIPHRGGFFFPLTEGTGWEFPVCIKPLEPHRADLNIYSAMSYKQIYQSSGSHGHAVAVFTGQKVVPPEPEKSRGPSVQHIAARAIGVGTRFSLVGTSLYSQGEGWWSWSAAAVKDPLETSPLNLFNRLFSNTNINPEAAAALNRRTKSVLDYVRADAADLQKQLGTEDRKRLDTHLASVRDLEKAATTLSPAASGVCTQPPAPMGGAPKTADGKNDYSRVVEYSQTMLRLHVMAHRCDLTRVSFFSGGGSQNYSTFPHLGIITDYHNVCHSGFNEIASVGPRIDDRKIAYEYYRKIATHYAEMFAFLLAQLKANDGMGSLLDQTAVVGLSDFGDGGVHEVSNVPVILAGKCGRTGAAVPNGRHINTAGRCLNDAWQSALLAIGATTPDQKFGDTALDTKPLDGAWV